MSGLNRRRPGPAMGGFSDSDANILASLAHEACEAHCSECDGCIVDKEPTETCEDCRADLEHLPPAYLFWEPWQDRVAMFYPNHKFAYAEDVPTTKGNQ